MSFDINIKKLTRTTTNINISSPTEKVDLLELVKVAKVCGITSQNKNYIKEFCTNIINQSISRQIEVFKSD